MIHLRFDGHELKKTNKTAKTKRTSTNVKIKAKDSPRTANTQNTAHTRAYAPLKTYFFSQSRVSFTCPPAENCLVIKYEKSQQVLEMEKHEKKAREKGIAGSQKKSSDGDVDCKQS